MRQKQDILILLSDRKWHINRDLNEISFRYSDRIFVMRKRGIDIEHKREDRKDYFRLVTPNGNIDFDNATLKPGQIGLI